MLLWLVCMNSRLANGGADDSDCIVAHGENYKIQTCNVTCEDLS